MCMNSDRKSNSPASLQGCKWRNISWYCQELRHLHEIFLFLSVSSSTIMDAFTSKEVWNACSWWIIIHHSIVFGILWTTYKLPTGLQSFVYIVPVWTSIYTLTNIYTTSSFGCQIISAVKHFSYVFSTFERSQEIQSTHYCWILLVTDVVKRRTFSELPNCFLYFSSVLFCIAPIGGLWCHCTSTFCQVPARPPCVISCLALMRYTCVSSFSLFLYLVSDLPVYLHSTVFALVGDFK